VRTFSVKNFEKFQHYKDRAPPWIKLYNELLDDYAFGALPDASKFHLVAIWLLASRSENKIPYDAAWVAKRINAGTEVDLDALVSAGFLLLDQGLHTTEHVASRPPAQRLSRERGTSLGEEENNIAAAVAAREPARKIEVSAEKQASIALGLAFLQALGFEDYAAPPPAYYEVPNMAAMWVEAGYSTDMIVGEATRIFSRQGAPRTPRFFENIFAEAHARAARPLPTVTVKDGEHLNVTRTNAGPNRSVASALREFRERLEQDDGSAGDGGSGAFGGLLAQG
jgi:hypothetical protein